jgi:hypothetical protein
VRFTLSFSADACATAVVLKQGKRVDVLTETDQAIRQQHEV